ncbi:enolase C-terminal domain-like protein [Mesorhizobium yinganensis]|uniref:enolase C-terminal domain-like protein n=1 Tax=Mesorhizobium yinganensis TaxID=3157707 RepID=UPI0032B748BA
MEIESIEAHLHSGQFSELVFVLVRTDDPEIWGWGECTLPGKPYAVMGAVRDAARLVLGADMRSIRQIWERAYRHGYWRGGAVETSALSGIDIALWDIAAKIAGVPVHSLLGGAVRSSIRTYANCGLSTDPDELARRARAAVQTGARIVKFYPLPPTESQPATQLVSQVYDCCAAVREAIGPDVDFALDFHGRPQAHAAVAIERAVRDLKPLWIEEPVPVEDETALAEARRHFQTPMAVGERLYTRWQFKRVLELHLADIIQPDVGNAGGLSEMRVLADMAETSSVVFNPHSPNGLVHTAASLHASAIAQTFGALEFRPSRDREDGIYTHEADDMAADGAFPLPQRTGLGLGVRPDRLAFDPARVPVLSEWSSDGTPRDW